MEKLYRILARVAQTVHPVLIIGESGTGKELVARAIHDNGQGAGKPFVPVDCGSLAPTLIESELFGHVKGAFTGAHRPNDGLMVAAGSGTVFLDEVAELPLDLQAKLLRALQEKEVRPLGGNHAVPIRARILAATHQDLTAMVEQGRFRRDLYYRLNVVKLTLPPLRERKEDIPAISDAIVTNLNQKHGCHVAGLHPEVLEAFQKASWPGNVRQLRNVLERAVIVAGEGSILPKHLSRDWSGGSSPLPVAADEESDDSIRIRVGPEMRQIEEAYINLVLKRTNNNKDASRAYPGDQHPDAPKSPGKRIPRDCENRLDQRPVLEASILLARRMRAGDGRNMTDQTGARQQLLRPTHDDMQAFLDRMVHDLREPLRAISIFAELLKKRSKDTDDPKNENAVDEILRGAARMRTLIEGISDYTSAQYRDRSAPGASLDLALRAAIDRLGPQIRDCGAKITAQPLPRVGAGLECLIQLFDHLIRNALRFRGKEPPEVQISAEQEANGEWTVRVQDNGIGVDMEPAEIESIFAPFTRLHGHKYPGAGLGLSICQVIVERHGGRIWAESSPRGTAFLFALPTADD
jgi:signal transduction histidine kinase